MANSDIQAIYRILDNGGRSEGWNKSSIVRFADIMDSLPETDIKTVSDIWLRDDIQRMMDDVHRYDNDTELLNRLIAHKQVVQDNLV